MAKKAIFLMENTKNKNMDKGKFKNFREYHGFDLTSIIPLSLEECEKNKKKLYSMFNVKCDKDFFHSVIKKSIHIPIDAEQIGGEENSIPLKSVFFDIGIIPSNSIYIIWDNLNDIDIIPTEDFCKYFEDIWYPSADDIGVFDASYSWIIIITHYGEILYYQHELLYNNK